MENRFMEMNEQFLKLSGRGAQPAAAPALSPGYAAAASAHWAQSQSAAQRALVVLIENGGVDLGIPELVDHIIGVLPGAGLIPSSLRSKLIEFIRGRLKSFTDNLLESAELTLNRYAAAKPDSYGDVSVLRNNTASYAELKARLIAHSKGGRLVDVLVLTHGSAKRIAAISDISDDDIRRMKAEYGKPLSIRSVYMMNCVGASLNSAWLDAGARVSCGSIGNNYLPEPTMFFFWRNWKAGQTFESAATSAYAASVKLLNDALKGFIATLPIPGIDAPLALFDFGSLDFVRESAPVIDGQRSLTINTDDLSFGQSTATGMATTVVPIRSLSVGDGTSAASPQQISPEGVEFIKGWQGFNPNLHDDPMGHHCLIGYGTRLHKDRCDGRSSEAPYLHGISKEEASRLLAADLAEHQSAVSSAVKVALNQNQFDALASFAHGVGARRFHESTLLKLLNEGNYNAVPVEMKKWTRSRRADVLVEVPGLADRRGAEAALFQKPAATARILSLPLGPFGRAMAQTGAVIPVRHSYEYHSLSTVTGAPTLAVQQNPAVIAGIAVADAIQIGLGAAAVAQGQISASQGSFSLAYDKAERLLTTEARLKMPGAQAAKKTYSLTLLSIGSTNPIVDFAHATIIIEWEGNPYGEIATPVIRRDLSRSSDWSKSSNNVTFSWRKAIPLPDTDPRAWPIIYTYEGTYDPAANGYFEYSGEFEINAFGGLKFTRHQVVSRSLVDFAISGKPEDYVTKGRDSILAVPTIPKDQLEYLRTKLP